MITKYVYELDDQGRIIEDLNGEPTFRVHYAYRPAADSAWAEQLVYYNDKLSEIRIKERRYFE